MIITRYSVCSIIIRNVCYIVQLDIVKSFTGNDHNIFFMMTIDIDNNTLILDPIIYSESMVVSANCEDGCGAWKSTSVAPQSGRWTDLLSQAYLVNLPTVRSLWTRTALSLPHCTSLTEVRQLSGNITFI